MCGNFTTRTTSIPIDTTAPTHCANQMSAYAVTPETYAAWRYLETDDEDLYEREQAEMLRGEEELGLLLAGTSSS